MAKANKFQHKKSEKCVQQFKETGIGKWKGRGKQQERLSLHELMAYADMKQLRLVYVGKHELLQITSIPSGSLQPQHQAIGNYILLKAKFKE